MELRILTYTSWARAGIRPDEVDAILASAKTNNPLDGITGVLIFNGTAFMQILEGSEAAIESLRARLESDPRHSNMSVRDTRLIEARTFPFWSMAYLRLESGEFHGKEEVVTALSRDLPQPVRNIVMGLTQSVLQEGPA
ncbi:MAG: BLUF domain-containing protein [Pseudomonadota bacterium]|nr:BLUF domain-containing protein [Pseudomonadota bacterium]